jgi:hypothetical protein
MKTKLKFWAALFLFNVATCFPAYAGQITATIPSGSSVSANVSLPYSSSVVRLQTPAAWTNANITIFISNDGGQTYQELYDGAGNEYTIAASASRNILLDPAVFAGVQNFYIQSGTTGLPVNQAASRTIIISVR